MPSTARYNTPYEHRTSGRFSTQAIASDASHGEFWERLYELGGPRIHDKDQEKRESHKEMLKMKEPPGMCMKTKAIMT
jgi:hypothetical protein